VRWALPSRDRSSSWSRLEQPPEAIGYGVEYLSVHSALAPLVLIYFATDNYLRVCGRQTISMIVNIATQVINIVATFVLVVLLHQGVMAAALASCGSIAIGSIVTLAMLFVKPGDEALLAMSVTAIKIFSFSYLVGWVDSSFSSFFTALDRPARSMVAAAFGTLVFPIASLFLLTSTLGLNGIWLTAPVSALASAVLALVLAKTMKLDDLHNGEAEELPA